ncbi:8-amino-7-oxononanoate synthase isoform X1 [Eucalyptus grandis]|uniref:8-amino-7-oxononanoate synthase isoform X1 n=2 Tax=Eucalyptus grandis TaxID=71139 RepID=UPI00192EFDBA|nr:8-amino-7-oxononanoate synthase isoform X1 [Eucalyptus grandis]XP_010035047.2 8-amino-7-oxononanoate synthase isoform X1 [Eucalyptus grandis]
MTTECSGRWDGWVKEALARLESLKIVRSLRPIRLSAQPHGVGGEAGRESEPGSGGSDDEYEVFEEMKPWDRTSVEVDVADSTFRSWLLDIPSSGEDFMLGDGLADGAVAASDRELKKLTLFSSNDYLGLSSHPTIGKAAAKAAKEHGMGPRGSALICGYTNYHRRLESCLAELKKKEECLLCPTGFAANMASMVAIGSISLLLAAGGQPEKDEKIAIFSDALNHASIIDGIRLAERQRSVEVFVYGHCDMVHLNKLLSACTTERKVVVTDSLFSMDGDFAPMDELVRLKRKHHFLLVIDDAHGTFVCGKNGGGVAEEFDCERDVDICVGTLSKAAGCHGGFIACSKRWKQLIQSRGRSFIFSTSTPVPVAAAAHAAVIVAKKETWRRRELWNRVQDFRTLTGIPILSPIISLIVGSEENALQGSRHLLESGFHVTAIRPPTVPPNSCRLRVTLTATHRKDDLVKLTEALSRCINFQEISIHCPKVYARL